MVVKKSDRDSSCAVQFDLGKSEKTGEVDLIATA
jgi:hypothetical protein